MQQPMQNPEDISDPTTAINMTLALMAKAFTLNNTTLTNNNQRSSSNHIDMQIAQPEIANQYGNGNVVPAPAEGNYNRINGNLIRCYNFRGEGHYASNYIVKSRKRDAAYLQQQLQIAQEKEEAEIQSTLEEYEFMAAADAYEETERVKVIYILENNLQQESTSGTQSNKASVYDSDGSAKVHLSENCYDNDIFNMFTQEEQYTELLEPIPEPTLKE
nr:hypothetical protein [Tanacetum cinerariifolium]